MSDPNKTIASQINQIADLLRERADVLAGYAEAIREDPTLAERLGDEHAGAPSANQILGEVENRSKAPDLYHLRHTVLTQLAHCQSDRTQRSTHV